MPTPDGAVGAARFAGARVARVEDPRLLTGHGTYVDDVVLPGMLHACFVRSPFARARIGGIDASAALSLPGVHAVFVPADLNRRVHEQWFRSPGPDGPTTPLPPLAEGEVRFVGDPVALVVADSRYVAEDAAELVDVDYEPLPAVVDYTEAQETNALVHDGYPHNVICQAAGGDAEAVGEEFAGARVVTEAIFQQGYAAVPMETKGIVVDWTAASGELTIWISSQAPHEARAFCARLTGVPEHRVRVVARDTGGAFGQKINVHREEMCIVLAALQVPWPLKWIEDRRENLLAAGHARHEHGVASVALEEDGSIVAARLDYVQDAGAYPITWPGAVANMTAMMFPGPYRIPRASFTATAVFSNTAGRTAYRGPWQFESVAREVLIDIAARRVGIDPVELRRRNLLRRDELPYTNGNGMPYGSASPLETFDLAIDMLDYTRFRRQQAEALAEGRYLGVGTSSYIEMTTPGSGHYASEGATIRIEPSGTVNVYVAGGSAGNSLETSVVQLTADALGVDIGDVNTIQGDTAVTPYGAGTGGSRSGAMLAGAVDQTAAELRQKLVAMAAHRLEAAPEDIELVAGRASVRGSPTIGLDLAELATIAYVRTDELPPGMAAGLEASGRFTAPNGGTWANATHVCTCEVDIVTGAVELLRYIVAEDCGPMINPMVVEGQIAGGTVQGIGGVLYEHLAYDGDGNPIATTFMDYLLPTAAEVPIIEHGHLETPGPAPGGYKGVGEGGAIGAPPAVINAVADALAPLGVTITRLPLGPADVVRFVEAAERGRVGSPS